MMKKKIDETECKGCLMYSIFNDECEISQIREKRDRCPCRHCLLKTCCQDTCEEFKRFSEGY